MPSRQIKKQEPKSKKRRQRYEAVLLDLDSRQVIRHPDIYANCRPTVAKVPAARSQPSRRQGESGVIFGPGEGPIRYAQLVLFGGGIASILWLLTV